MPAAKNHMFKALGLAQVLHLGASFSLLTWVTIVTQAKNALFVVSGVRLFSTIKHTCSNELGHLRFSFSFHLGALYTPVCK